VCSNPFEARWHSDLRLYDLRHSYAALALQAGASARLISEQLGHRSVAFTLETYGHLLEETREETAQRLSDLNFSLGLGPRSEKKPALPEMASAIEKLA